MQAKQRKIDIVIFSCNVIPGEDNIKHREIMEAELRKKRVRIFRDIDMYVFFIKLLDTITLREYMITKRLDGTILGFMSTAFKKTLFATTVKSMSVNEAAFLAIKILHSIKEPIGNIFTIQYLDRLSALNYKLFK